MLTKCTQRKVETLSKNQQCYHLNEELIIAVRSSGLDVDYMHAGAAPLRSAGRSNVRVGSKSGRFDAQACRHPQGGLVINTLSKFKHEFIIHN